MHFEAYGAMFLAQREVALTAAQELQDLLPVSVVAFLPDLFEAFWGMVTHVMVRFGMWQELVDQSLPEDGDLFCFTTALMRYGRVIAFANLGQNEAAREELSALFAAKEVVDLKKSRFMFNNPATDILNIAVEMAQGECYYKAGDIDVGLNHLRQATAMSDELVYDEPWGWMQPPRHALAALLMEQAQFDEAELLYRADLGISDDLARIHQHPNNVWALHGLHECLERRGETQESRHIKLQLDRVLARSDVTVGSSCYCRTLST